MLGTQLTLKLAGSSEHTITLDRISDDGLSARYFKHDATQDYQLDVRHSVDKNGISKHYLTFTQTVFATTDRPEYKTVADFSFKANNAFAPNGTQKVVVTTLTDFIGATESTSDVVDKLIGLNS